VNREQLRAVRLFAVFLGAITLNLIIIRALGLGPLTMFGEELIVCPIIGLLTIKSGAGK
jgi:hypothetical protein